MGCGRRQGTGLEVLERWGPHGDGDGGGQLFSRCGGVVLVRAPAIPSSCAVVSALIVTPDPVSLDACCHLERVAPEGFRAVLPPANGEARLEQSLLLLGLYGRVVGEPSCGLPCCCHHFIVYCASFLFCVSSDY